MAECACPEGFPRYAALQSPIDDPRFASVLSSIAVRWERHTGDCDRHDALQVFDGGEWQTVYGGA